MGKLGDYFSQLTYLQSIFVIALPILLIGGSVYGGYSLSKGLAEVKCLGCLGLDPVAAGFTEFWIDYPSGHPKAGQAVPHPSFLEEALDTKPIVLVFIWGPACPPCEKQWKDMRARGLVSGEEAGGQLVKYTESVAFFSLDASTSSNGATAVEVYNPSATPAGTPTTIFAMRMKDESGKEVIGWFSQKGYMDPVAVENVLTIALNMHH